MVVATNRVLGYARGLTLITYALIVFFASAAVVTSVSIAPASANSGFAVGDTGPGGGKIFYVNNNGFACGPDRSATCTYLEAAPSGWHGGGNDPSRTWSQSQYHSVSVNMAASHTGIGWGYSNTRAIINQGSTDTATSAAALADAHTVTVSGVVYDDWYLPSSSELYEMWRQRNILGMNNSSAIFSGDPYWSSSEINPSNAYYQIMYGHCDTCGTLEQVKSYSFYVRPVRAGQPAPNVTFSTTTSTPRNDSNASYDLLFTQSVTGLAADDFENAGSATGCTFAISGSGTTYTLTISDCSDGTIQPRLKANSVTGSALDGPTSAATATTTITIDRVAPTASVTTATILATSNASVQSSETGTAYLVNETVTVTNLASITGASGDLWNSVAISTANSNTNLAASGLRSGTYKVYAVDAAGNLSAASTNTISIKPATPGTPDLDAASDLGTSNTDNNTADDTPTFTITSIESGTVVTLTATPASGSAVTCSFTATSTSGSCTFDPMPNGTYSIRAVQSGGGVNSDAGTALSNVVINKISISTPATPDLDASSDHGISNTDDITRDNTPTINVQGTFTGTAIVTATKSGSSPVTCTISSGACTLPFLSDGVWSVRVTDSDSSGNSATSAALSLTIDTVSPIRTPKEVRVDANGKKVVVFQSNEPGTSFLWWMDCGICTTYPRYEPNPGGTTDTIPNIRTSNRPTPSWWKETLIPAANTSVEFFTAGVTYDDRQFYHVYYSLYVFDVAGNMASENQAWPNDPRSTLVAVFGGLSQPSATSTSAPSGTKSFGQTLTNSVTFSGTPTPTTAIQWKRCTSTSDSSCSNIDGATSSSYTLTLADVGMRIRTEVTASNGVGSNLTTLSSVTSAVLAAPPSVPTSVTTTITGATTATVSFTAPTSNGGAAITGYTVTSNPAGAKCVVGVNATTYECTRLTPNTAYTFTVKATNSAGTGSSSQASSSVTTQAAPTLSVSKYDTNQNLRGPNDTPISIPSGWVTLTDPCANYSQYFSYSFSLADGCRSIYYYGNTNADLVLNNGNSASLTLNFVNPVSSFIFDVAAVDNQSPDQVHMLVFYDDSNPDSFYVGNSGFISHPITANGSSSTRYQVSFPDGRPIKKIGLNFNSNGTGGTQDVIIFDNFSFVVTPLSATTSVSTKSLTSGTAATSFTPITASGGGSSKTYSISPSLPAGLSLNTSTGAITGTPSGASASTTYTVTVIADSSTASATFTLGVNAALTSAAGSVPSGVYKDVAVTAFTPISFSGGTSPISYAVSPSLPAGLTLNTSTGVISGTATGTAANTTYTVTATDANGDTEASTFAFAVTDAPTTPDAPTIGAATSTGQTTATVAFTAPANTGGAAITTYTVTASPGGITATGSSSPITVTGLTAGTAYTFSITATNAGGLTSTSSSPSSSITTESAPAPSSGGGGGGGGSPAPEPDPEPSCNAACIAAQNAVAERAAAERAAAEKAAAEKVAAEKVAAEKAVAEKAVAEKAVAEKVAAEKAAAVAVAEKTRVDLAAAAAIARAAVEIATAAESAKVEVENVAEAVSSVLSSANSSTADTAKITNDALASIESAPAVASKAARAKSADKAAETAASEVRAAAKAAEKAAKSTKTQELSNPEIVIGSQGAGSTSSQALSQANDVARAAKAAAKQVAAAAATKASESKAVVETLQSDVDAAIAEVSAQQEIATTLALEAKNAAEIATAATAEKIAATSAAKSAAETLLALLTEKVTLAEQASNATTQEILLQVQQQIESVNLKIAEAEKTLQETSSKAELAIAAQSQAVALAERTKTSTEEQLAKVEELQTLLPSKTQAVVRAIKAAAVAEKVATAAKQAAAKIPSSAVIARKPGISTGKNSTRATISGLKPGQKVKVIVNVKPGGKP